MRFGVFAFALYKLTKPSPSERLAVFVFVLVIEHAEIGLVAAFGNVVVLQRAEHGASGLVAVGAVAETAVLREVEDVTEIARQLFRFDVERSKTFYSGRIDNIAALRKGQHLAERGGVHARVVGVADLGRAQVYARQEAVDECRFADTAVAAEHGDAPDEHPAQLFDAAAGSRRHGTTLISDVLIERNHHVLIPPLVIIKYVGLVEDKHDRHAVGLGRSQKAVDEGRAGLRPVDRDDEQGLVDVGGDDVTLLREVGRLADDVVAAVADGGNESRSLGVLDYLHAVADGHGIGAPDAFQPEVSLYLAVHHPPVIRLDGVPASGVSYY